MPRPQCLLPQLPIEDVGVIATTPHQDLRPPPPACSSSVCGGAGQLRPVCWLSPTGSGSFPGDMRGLGNAGAYSEALGTPPWPSSALCSLDSPHPLWGATSLGFAQTQPSLPGKRSNSRQRVEARAMAVGTGLGRGEVRRLQCSSEILPQFLLSPCGHLLENSILVAGKRRDCGLKERFRG